MAVAGGETGSANFISVAFLFPCRLVFLPCARQGNLALLPTRLVVTADGDCDDEMRERDKAIAYILVCILLAAVWYEMSTRISSLSFLSAIDCCETQQQSQARA